MTILIKLISFLCDVSRFDEASHLAGPLVGQLDLQPVFRRPLRVLQLEMNCGWTGLLLFSHDLHRVSWPLAFDNHDLCGPGGR